MRQAAKRDHRLCYDKKTGDLKWRKDVHQGGLGKLGHNDSSFASATIACDGQRLFAAFLNTGAIYVTALDLNGRQLWQTKAGDGFGGEHRPPDSVGAAWVSGSSRNSGCGGSTCVAQTRRYAHATTDEITTR